MPTFKKIKYEGAECATAHADHASVADTAASATSAGTATSASEAAKLSTARTIKTDLASASAASFDGSGNVTPGVTGVLPIQNGGTGRNSGTVGITNTEISTSAQTTLVSGTPQYQVATVTVDYTGVALILINGYVAPTSSGLQILGYSRNSNTVQEMWLQTSTAVPDNNYMNGQVLASCTAGDTFGISLFQNSGASVGQWARISVVRIM